MAETEIQDPRDFCEAVFVLFGGMAMADSKVLDVETSAIRVFLSVAYGIDPAQIDRAQTAFQVRVAQHAEARDPDIVDEAFARLDRYFGQDLDRKRGFLRLLFALAKADGILVAPESAYGQQLGRAFALPLDEIATCQRVGTEIGNRLLHWASVAQEQG